MDYVRKQPLNYKDIAENLKGPAWYDIEDSDNLLIDGAQAIEELLHYQSAIESMGNRGKLFLPYSGCARGCVGRSGVNGIKAEVCMFNPITDVDGGKWRPVNEDALQELLGQFEILQSKCSDLISKIEEIMKLYPAGDFCGWCGNQDVCEQNNLKECNPKYMYKD